MMETLFMRIFAVLAGAALFIAIVQNASAGIEEDCVQESDWDLKVGGCTAAIQSGQWSGKGLAWAYNNRGNAYWHLGEFRRAIENYDQALWLDPRNEDAYNGRGLSYEYIGEFERAVEDYERDMQINGASKVKWWQNHLTSYGHYDGAIDGVYGADTRRALMACTVDPNC